VADDARTAEDAFTTRPSRHLDGEAIDQTVLQRLRAQFPDPGVCGELVDMYLSALQNRVSAIQAAVDTLDADGLDRSCHTLGSASALVGARELAALCRQLEAMGRDDSMGGAVEVVNRLTAEAARVGAALAALRHTDR
jgi:two-component system sensor histidine kinase/response regulator